jgi:hypothetical protein
MCTGSERDEEGHALVVRNGKGRTRKITLRKDVEASTYSALGPDRRR